jgi:hypothetical protein
MVRVQNELIGRDAELATVHEYLPIEQHLTLYRVVALNLPQRKCGSSRTYGTRPKKGLSQWRGLARLAIINIPQGSS